MSKCLWARNWNKLLLVVQLAACMAAAIMCVMSEWKAAVKCFGTCMVTSTFNSVNFNLNNYLNWKFAVSSLISKHPINHLDKQRLLFAFRNRSNTCIQGQNHSLITVTVPIETISFDLTHGDMMAGSISYLGHLVCPNGPFLQCYNNGEVWLTKWKLHERSLHDWEGDFSLSHSKCDCCWAKLCQVNLG